MGRSQARDDGRRSGPATRRRIYGPGSESPSLRLSYRAGHPPRLARWCTPKRPANSIVAFRSAKVRGCNCATKIGPTIDRPSVSLAEPGSPHVRAQPSQNSPELGRDRRLAFAEQPTRVIDEQQIAAQRKNSSTMPSHDESSFRRSSIGQRQTASSNPAAASEPTHTPVLGPEMGPRFWEFPEPRGGRHRKARRVNDGIISALRRHRPEAIEESSSAWPPDAYSPTHSPEKTKLARPNNPLPLRNACPPSPPCTLGSRRVRNAFTKPSSRHSTQSRWTGRHRRSRRCNCQDSGRWQRTECQSAGSCDLCGKAPRRSGRIPEWPARRTARPSRGKKARRTRSRFRSRVALSSTPAHNSPNTGIQMPTMSPCIVASHTRTSTPRRRAIKSPAEPVSRR